MTKQDALGWFERRTESIALCDKCVEAENVAMLCIAESISREPHVLTQDEMTVLGRIGGAVYIEEYPAYRARCCWVLVTPGVEPPKDKPYNYPGGVLFNATDADGDIWDGDFYGLEMPLGWRAWSGKPTEEQRRNTPWPE